MKSDEHLQLRITRMREINSNFEYHALTVTADANGKLKWSVFTHFDGWGDVDMRTEIRAPSIIIAENMMKLWSDNGEGYVVVNNIDDLRIYLLIGGNCLIETTLAIKELNFMFITMATIPDNGIGFKSISDLPKSAWVKAPTPKLRMQVIKRESYRCFICGRSPASNTDVELHVHHIKPFGKGGLTEESNLITLCHTCHKSLEPHFDINLQSHV